MWPWEHAAVAYLAYSLSVRAVTGRAPREWPVLALALGSQFPDLIDKPAEWVFGVLPSTGVAHSVFTAVPLTLVLLAVGARRGWVGVSAGFAVGYLLHLPGDVFYDVILGNEPSYDKVLWPLVPGTVRPDVDLVALLTRFFDRYAEFILSPAGVAYLLGEVALVGGAVVLWLADGRPGLGVLRRLLWRLIGRPGQSVRPEDR
jgi:hypothetical protein